VAGTVSGAGDVETTDQGSVSLANETAADNGANLAWALGKSGTDAITALTLAEDATLTTTATVPEGLTLMLAGDLTVDTDGVLTIEDDAAFDGSGVIITANTGTITVGTTEGYTAPSAGIEGSDIGDAITALAADVAKLTNVDGIDLNSTFGANVKGIGTVTITVVSTATAVKDNATYASGSAITLSSGTTISAQGTASYSGTDSSDINDDASAALSVETSTLSLADAGYESGDAKVAVVTFTGTQLANGGLVTPALAAFNIGLTTARGSD
jgi:hypothetical protein